MNDNLNLSEESKKILSDCFAKAHIEKFQSLESQEKKEKFHSKIAKELIGDDKEESIKKIKDIFESSNEKALSELFNKVDDQKFVNFNRDKDGYSAFRPDDLSQNALESYCKTIDFKGKMLVSFDDGEKLPLVVSNYEKGTQADPEDKPFATHSVSKLIAGVAICKLISENKTLEEALDKKLELSEDVLKKLPEKIKNYLASSEVTLRDVMTHKSGLGGYLDPELKEGQEGYVSGEYKLGYGSNGYSGYVASQLKKGEEIVVPREPEDYLQYAETEIYQKGEWKYSDLGILLASLSIEHLYNKDKSEHKSFEELIKENLTNPAGVERFSAIKPDDAICHSDDKIAPYITGTAGCGYWTNLDGMQKIGHHIFKLWQNDENFQRVVKDCGEEFYREDLQIIGHAGGIDSSKTWLSVDLKSGDVVVTEERRIGNDFPLPGLGVASSISTKQKKVGAGKPSPEPENPSFKAAKEKSKSLNC